MPAVKGGCLLIQHTQKPLEVRPAWLPGLWGHLGCVLATALSVNSLKISLFHYQTPNVTFRLLGKPGFLNAKTKKKVARFHCNWIKFINSITILILSSKKMYKVKALYKKHDEASSGYQLLKQAFQ